MSDTNKLGIDAESKAHIDSMHRLGRIGAAIAVAIMIGMPVIAGIYFNAMPGLVKIITTSIGLLALFVPGAISEVIAYTPIFGSSIYLAQITGNIMNLKLPVANAALQLLDVESGTEEADIVTSIAVSVSSFVTIIVIFLGVLLILPLRPVLTLPAVKLASGYIVPALFGSLTIGAIGSNIGGGIKTKGRLKGMILPVIIVAAVNIIVVYIIKKPMLLAFYQGFLMLALLPISYFGTKLFYKNGQIQVFLPGEGK
ncbi:hypothetical protein [Treponema primitia]|uniref:hypothetical protein n=1 Tax=Treponema primitia TaxID=88058 RepID=UPI00025552B7|nr:hypothetical protein [Treponema primitia]